MIRPFLSCYLNQALLFWTACLRILSQAPDTRLRIQKLLKEWDWVPLVQLIANQEVYAASAKL